MNNIVTSEGDIEEILDNLRELLVKYVIKRHDIIEKITIEKGRPIIIEIIPTIRKMRR